jgi:hypothetical protein
LQTSCASDAGTICTSLDSDPLNCGACGTKCPNNRCTAGKCDRIIFVTTQSGFPGNFGSLNIADNECHKSATAAKLPGTYKAWLSTSTVSADSRVSHSSLPYVLVDGTKVANDYAGLLAPPLAHAIDHTETGVVVANNDIPEVWTGTFQSGLGAPDTCGDWVAANASGTVGLATATSALWTSNTSKSCAVTVARLYCLQQ